VALDAVVVAEHADDAALRPGGGALVHVALGQHHHRMRGGEVQRHGEPCQAGADDHHSGQVNRKVFANGHRIKLR
jgi:hypothetical protein